MKTMKAVRIHEYGPPSVLQFEDAPMPELLVGDALVRVYAAGVNPVDAKIRSGMYRQYTPFELPLTPGWDFAGVVERVDAAGNGFHVGDEVFARPDAKRNGAYAEYIAVKATELAMKPSSLDHNQAAAVPLASCTAWQALFDMGGLGAGQKVLIHAASGGVGSFAVQLARWRGAVVIGTASAKNREFVEGLGIHQFIDYESQRFEDVVAGDVDLVLDTMGGDTLARSWQLLKPEGILVSLVDRGVREEGERRGLRAVNFMMQPNAAELREVGDLIDAGHVKVFVDEIMPLSDAVRAHETIERHHTRGKLVLKVP